MKSFGSGSLTLEQALMRDAVVRGADPVKGKLDPLSQGSMRAMKRALAGK